MVTALVWLCADGWSSTNPIMVMRLDTYPLLMIKVETEPFVWKTYRHLLTLAEPVEMTDKREGLLKMTASQVKGHLKQFRRVLRRVFRKVTKRPSSINSKQLKKRAIRVIKLERGLANITRPSLTWPQTLQSTRNHNLSDLQNRYPAIDWRRFLHGVFEAFGVHNMSLPDDMVVASYADSYMDQLFPLLNNTHPQAIGDYLMWSAVSRLAVLTLGKVARALGVWVLSSTVDKTKQLCAGVTEQILPEVVGQMYTDAFISKANLQKGRFMAEIIVSSFKHIVKKVRWLSASAKQHALNKVNTLRVAIGNLPGFDNMSVIDRDYDGIKAFKRTLLRNFLVIRGRDMKRQLLVLKHQTGDLKLPVNSAVANAYFLPRHNLVFIPSGLFRPPAFTTGLPEALNYGTVGMLIGHEVMHMFYDMKFEFGLRNWWEPTDEHNYNVRTRCIQGQCIRRLSQYTNDSVNANLTTEEDIADIGGVRAAFLALANMLHDPRFHNTTIKQRLKRLPHLSPKQLFFISFAHHYCEYDFGYDPDHTHSLAKFRVLGSVINSPYFGDVFNCSVGTPMNPRTKCRVW